MGLQILVKHPGGALWAAQAQPDDSVASVSGRCFPEAAGAGVGALRVVYGGRTLDPSCSLAAAGVGPGSTLELLPRLRGGGGDGGSTGAESRSSYLEMYRGKVPDKVNPEEERLARWTTCQLSGMPLQPPCVADELGSLFNKDAVLQALVTKSMPKPLGHITGLKHLTPLKLEPTAGGGADGSSRDVAAVSFACPITGQPLNGKYKFVVMRKTGHVVSERALKEVPSVVEELIGGKWEAADLMTVNPTGDELDELRQKLMIKRAAGRVAKKEKKKDKAAAAAGEDGHAGVPGAAGASEANGAGSKRAAQGGDGAAAAAAAADGGRTGRAAAAAAASKRLKTAELKPMNADDEIWSSLFTSSKKVDPGKTGNTDYMCRATTHYVA